MHRPTKQRPVSLALDISNSNSTIFVSLMVVMVLLSGVAMAQGSSGGRRGGVASGRPKVAEAGRPLLRQDEPKGWVWVTQTVDISRQLGSEKEIMTLDGEPMPSLIRKRVTLGLVLDDQGHIATRLIDVTPQNPPKAVTVRSIETRSVEAVFLGMDLVSGICILKAEGSSLAPARFYQPDPLPARFNIQLYGFHPNQRMSMNAAIVLSSPRRNTYSGQIARAIGDFRYQPDKPIYHLLTPKLTAVQDGSLILGPGKSVFGVAIYDSNNVRGEALVYTTAKIAGIAESIIRSRQSISYGWFGATGRDVILGPTATGTRRSNDEAGVRIIAVAPDSPAEKAGVIPKDILLSINEQRILNYAQLASLIRQLPPDSDIIVRVRRDSEVMTLKAKLVPVPSADPAQQILAFSERLKKMEDELSSLGKESPNLRELELRIEKMRLFLSAVTVPAPPEIRLRVFYGIEAMPLTGQLMNHFVVTGGLLITGVAERSHAAEAGLKAGDVVVRIGSETVRDMASLLIGLDNIQSSRITLTIVRNREEKSILMSR